MCIRDSYGKKGRGVKLEAGMVIAIEPMIPLGSNRVHTGADGWLVSTNAVSYTHLLPGFGISQTDNHLQYT